ncbi:MAG: hypothetical protein JWQ43_595 [Glaciihabitans sp.]|nr:hypothetical protein [Glaciihabitans sp.]
MLRRRRGIAVAIAILCGSASSVMMVLPATAAVGQDISPFSVTAPEPPDTRATLVEPTPAGNTDSVVTDHTNKNETPVAESPARQVTPLIMVTGLAMLIGAIYLMMRSGSSRRNAVRE